MNCEKFTVEIRKDKHKNSSHIEDDHDHHHHHHHHQDIFGISKILHGRIIENITFEIPPCHNYDIMITSPIITVWVILAIVVCIFMALVVILLIVNNNAQKQKKL